MRQETGMGDELPTRRGSRRGRGSGKKEQSMSAAEGRLRQIKMPQAVTLLPGLRGPARELAPVHTRRDRLLGPPLAEDTRRKRAATPVSITRWRQGSLRSGG